MKRKILVTGGAGFIGGHLAKYLLDQGHEAYIADIKKQHEFRDCDFCPTVGMVDLRDPDGINYTLKWVDPHGFDDIYHLAANMGGMWHLDNEEFSIVYDNSRINLNMMEAILRYEPERFFFSSSVCIYPDMNVGDLPLSEDDAYPALADNEYGFEKLNAERLFLLAGKNSKTQVRIARFQNCYGELGTYKGGREKAPAAIARKIANIESGGEIQVWGDGEQVRNFIHVDDMVRAIVTLMESDEDRPVNIGTEEYVTINQLVETTARAAQKEVKIKHVDGPVGVRSRNFTHDRIHALGWQPSITLEQGMERVYNWIESQVKVGINK